MDLEQRKDLSEKKKRHGHANCRVTGAYASTTYRAWTAMIARCEYEKHALYHRYGGRGIKVCERWRNSFEAFLEDMGPRPARHSLDRINNDGNYEPGNCRWATAKEQGRNMIRNRLLTFRGETLCMSEWAERLGVNYKTIESRINRYGWSVEKALSTPPRKTRNNTG